jgi:tripartite-type tricarboxylate transporter receptor subunit TctC
MKTATTFRRSTLFTLMLSGLCITGAYGQGSFPDKPVKIVVAFAPGAGTDAMGRLMAQKLGEVMGGSFVVENRTGASGAMPGTPSAQTRFIEADYQA